ncbi:hypothetical protein B4U80_13833 [Leptotrombidium deliense]|uniref:Fibronectin type-III domain-containing protein n=1 Tax=Leptotrombidium deliense TaxID=299467 RepID=A0A443SBV9_9ACAR|nr:hypothetical protein B4U80_13833 [Leptotrombidium deliense]
MIEDKVVISSSIAIMLLLTPFTTQSAYLKQCREHENWINNVDFVKNFECSLIKHSNNNSEVFCKWDEDNIKNSLLLRRYLYVCATRYNSFIHPDENLFICSKNCTQLHLKLNKGSYPILILKLNASIGEHESRHLFVIFNNKKPKTPKRFNVTTFEKYISVQLSPPKDFIYLKSILKSVQYELQYANLESNINESVYFDSNKYGTIYNINTCINYEIRVRCRLEAISRNSVSDWSDWSTVQESKKHVNCKNNNQIEGSKILIISIVGSVCFTFIFFIIVKLIVILINKYNAFKAWKIVLPPGISKCTVQNNIYYQSPTVEITEMFSTPTPRVRQITEDSGFANSISDEVDCVQNKMHDTASISNSCESIEDKRNEHTTMDKKQQSELRDAILMTNSNVVNSEISDYANTEFNNKRVVSEKKYIYKKY